MARQGKGGNGTYQGAHSGAHSRGSAPRQGSASGSGSMRPVQSGSQGSGYRPLNSPAQKPKKSGGKKAAIVVIILVILAAAGFAAWRFGLFTPPETKPDVTPGVAVEVTIPEGSSTSAIASVLYEADVIADEGVFKKAVSSAGAESSLKPGTYQLTTLMDTGELVDTLVAGPSFYGSRLSIPEGYTISKTAAAVEDATGIPAADFEAAAHNASDFAAEFPFVPEVYGNSLEGYLFPKTYDVPEGATAPDIVRMMLNQFSAELEAAGLTVGGANGMSLAEIVNVAAMVQAETGNVDEMPIVASVIYNRLDQGIALQIDSTVIYALGDAFVGPTVTYEDLEVESPYNTYRMTGLPAGPICSPGIEALKAAANPAQTEYLYYLVTGENGEHSFFENYNDFLAAKGA